ncbi:MAG: methylated-DNA--[protein]-cysteine S-methyltransferase [Vibrio sp.]
MSVIHIQFYKHPYAEFILGSYQNQVCLCDFRYRKLRDTVDNRIKQGLNAEFIEQNDEVLDTTKQQLSEYFQGERTAFDLPLLTVGTPFQKSVWQALQTVPYGHTTSYGDLAKQLGQPTAFRAVANANGANAHAIIIPCHRVIASNGGLGGYGGGVPLKQKLLALETRLI